MASHVRDGQAGKSSVQLVGELHQRYASVIYDKCWRMLGDQQAEDATQETFARAIVALDRFVYAESYLPWLYRIASNVCIDELRRRKRRSAELPLREELIAQRCSDLEQVLHVQRTLCALLDQLDQRSLEILVAHYLDGMTQEQIAGQLGISRRAVVKRLTRLRQRAPALDQSPAAAKKKDGAGD